MCTDSFRLSAGVGFEHCRSSAPETRCCPSATEESSHLRARTSSRNVHLKHHRKLELDPPPQPQDSLETLKGSFLSTHWDMFQDLGTDEATGTITCDIKFCVDCVVIKKGFITHPNNELYRTREEIGLLEIMTELA